MNRISKIAGFMLPILIIIFIVIWAGKSKKPIDNTESTTPNVGEVTAWWENPSTEENTVDNSIPEEYIKVPTTNNLYMVVDENNNVESYVMRTVNDDGSYSWNVFNKNISSIMTHIEGDVYKYVDEHGVAYYFQYTEAEDGSYKLDFLDAYEESTEQIVKTEVKRETKKEDGFIVVYETIIYKTFNSSGELINTKSEGPTIVSKTKEADPDAANIEWINNTYNEKASDVVFVDDYSLKVLEYLNEDRRSNGCNEMEALGNASKEVMLSKILAGDLIKSEFNFNSATFNAVQEKFKDYNIVTLTLPLSVGDTAETVAKYINDQFNSNSSTKQVRCSNKYSSVGIAIAKTEQGYVIVEVYANN